MISSLHDILSAGWGTLLLRGAGMTVFISLCGICLGMAIGIAGAALKAGGGWLARGAIGLYTLIVRSVPELLIIYLLFFGTVQPAADLADWLNWDDLMSTVFPVLVGILAIGLISGSYSVEVFRGAFKAIDPGQIEAARAIGMDRRQCLWRITLPQLLWYALPGANNVWQNALKDTALISLVGLVELMRAAVLGAAATRAPLTLYLLAGILYFLIGVCSQGMFVWAERHFGRGMQGAAR
ncbi:ABC transporter permease subunit [Castellaniella sp. MT123]|uniref:ABC transporter permease n=1 Tax=Castellaniella sp. MT123 TaxID=3140381 RepID=UPI0031F34093|nr:ABC transporter permease subunit [Castellaniella sp.]